MAPEKSALDQARDLYWKTKNRKEKLALELADARSRLEELENSEYNLKYLVELLEKESTVK